MVKQRKNKKLKKLQPPLDFKAKQKAFAAHLRHPFKHPALKGIEDRRMAIYRDLFYNNIENFLKNNFPVLRSLLKDADWHDLVRDFFHKHTSKSPYFLQIPEEFIDYLQHERKTKANDPPFMLELAHYEWVELALDVMPEDIDLLGINQRGDILHGIPVLSNLAWPLAYHYPVHCISSTYQPKKPLDERTYLIVYRNRQDQVKFLHTNAVTVRLTELLRENPHFSGLQALECIANEMQHPNPEIVIQGGQQTLEHLRSLDIILGVSLKSVS